ncbi:hypothetical protein TWF694_005085 [Orbilia ellipsospora]|uniref:GED domain-containing protein n=1 Tax=Orbilia ellipsospora TaxID=2528407 RepID=A0AAV9WUU9_9PEZI
MAIVRATILPGPTSIRNETLKRSIQSFEYTCNESDFGHRELQELLSRAGKVMGIDAEGYESIASKRFSDDILKIELAARHHHHLTIVDIPGLFHNPTKNQTDEDKVLIRKLIQHYLNDPRTIIIAVMNGYNNLATQEVFKMARKADPEGKRTVGVITRCDDIPAGDEHEVLQIAANKLEFLRHGWFVVKNRSTKETREGVTLEQRQQREEDFFRRDPWNTLKPDQIGVENLKIFLGRLLYRHIQGELPKLAEEIGRIIMVSREKLEELGDARVDAYRQREYLAMLAKDYETQVTRYLKGEMGQILDKNNPLKIRSHVQRLNDEFAASIKDRGHTRLFKTLDGLDDDVTSDPPDVRTRDDVSDVESDAGGEVPDDARSTLHNFRDLENEAQSIYQDSLQALGPRDMYAWIRETYHTSRGPELKGIINPYVVVELFREQAKNWREFGRRHINAVAEVVRRFNLELFSKVIKEDRVRGRIMMAIARATYESIKGAYSLFDELVEDEFTGILQTVDEDYIEKREAARMERIRLRQSMSLEDVMAAHKRDDVIVEDIHDILKAYYPVAMKRFIATINLQVIERRLLGENSPIRLFKTEYIVRLTDEELHNLTREDLQVINTRKELQSQLDRATEALMAANSI